MEQITSVETAKMDDYLFFAEGTENIENESQNKWKVMIIDDEHEVHKITEIVLGGVTFEGKKLQFINGYSEKEARELILQHPDTAVIILDVVMERDNSGLEIVKYIRDELKNRFVRIILRTGQPGQAPEERVIMEYDINDYKEKTELTARRLFTTLVSALRSYRDIMTVHANRKGLEQIIESTANIYKLQSMKMLTSGILEQLTSILQLNKDAVFCKTKNPVKDEDSADFYIVAGIGAYKACEGKMAKGVLPKEMLHLMQEAVHENRNIYTGSNCAIYFKSAGRDNIICLTGSKPMDELDRNLIEFFLRNISSAYDSIYINNVIMDNLNEAVLLVDNKNRVVTMNDTFKKQFFENVSTPMVDSVKGLILHIKDNITNLDESQIILDAMENTTETGCISGEISFSRPHNLCFRVSISPLIGMEKEILGKIITFNDITRYKKLVSQLNQKNFELQRANGQLKEYVHTAEELAVIKERNRFARDMHDTLGHTMTLLIALLEVSMITCKEDADKTEEKIVEAIRIAREGLKNVRRSISGLAPYKLEAASLVNALEVLIEGVKSSGVEVHFSSVGMDGFIDPSSSNVVYRACQEALTNSVRHGKAKRVVIILKHVDDKISLSVFDDGNGCKHLEKGFGLSGMEQRVKDICGTITYGSFDEGGFSIHIEIPLKVGGIK